MKEVCSLRKGCMINNANVQAECSESQDASDLLKLSKSSSLLSNILKFLLGPWWKKENKIKLMTSTKQIPVSKQSRISPANICSV